MNWTIDYIAEARKDFDRLDHSQQIHVVKAIEKVSVNPLPTNEGGMANHLEIVVKVIWLGVSK